MREYLSAILRKMEENDIDLPSLIANLIELAIIWYLGRFIQADKTLVTVVILVFEFARMTIGKALHYISWWKCAASGFMSILSLIALSVFDPIIAVMVSVFGAFILSGHANLKDITFFTPPGQSKYQDEMDFVTANPHNHALLEFESKLSKDKDQTAYLVYTSIFKRREPWRVPAEQLQVESYVLKPVVERVAFTIRMMCDIWA